jgi:hypothetical protein
MVEDQGRNLSHSRTAPRGNCQVLLRGRPAKEATAQAEGCTVIAYRRVVKSPSASHADSDRRSVTGSPPSQILDPKVLFFLDNRDSKPLSIRNQFRPVDLAAGHHFEIGSNAGQDGPARIPALPKLQGRVRVQVVLIAFRCRMFSPPYSSF